MLHRRYRFQPQDHGFDPGDEAFATGTGKSAGTIVALDDVAGIIELKRSRNSEWPHPVALMAAAPLEQRPEAGACSGSPTRSSRTASTATEPTAPSATCSCASRLADGWAGVRARRAGRGVPRRRTAARVGTRCGNAADPGATRHGQDLRRGADDPRPRRGREAGRRDRAVPQDDQQHARGRRRGGDRGAASRVRIIQKADSDVGQIEGVDPASARNADVAAALAAGTVDVVAGDRLALRSTRVRRRLRRPVRGRGEPDVARERRRTRDQRPVDRPASATRTSCRW